MNYRRGWICLFICTLTAINYADRVALSVAAKPVSIEFGLSPVEMGYLLSSFLWMYIVCLIPVGILADRYGGKIIISSGIGLWSAATMLTGLAPNFLFMLITRITMGIGESTGWPACNRIIREWFPASERGFANAFLGAGASAGPALGALGISAIVATWGWRAGFLVAGGIGFVWLMVWHLVFDRPDRVGWLRAAERDKILAERDGDDRLAEADRPVSSLRYLLGLRSVWGLFLTQGCEVYGGYMLLTWLPSYLQQAKGLSIMNAGMMTAIPFGIASVLAVVLGHVSDRLLTRDAVQAGQRRVMLAVLLAGAAGILAVPLLNALWAIILVLTCVRTMGLTASGLIFTLGTDLVRNRADVAKVTSITAMGGNAFGLASPIITGYIVGITGSFDSAFFIAGALPLIGATSVLVMTQGPIRPQIASTPAPGLS